MKRVNLFLTLIIIVLAGVVGWILGNTRIAKKTATPNDLQMSVKSISQADNFYNIQAEYPQFSNASQDFNNKISKLINGEISAFKKAAKDNWNARMATAPADQALSKNPSEPFDFIETWNPMQLNNKYLSFVVKIYNFSGGAHGINEVYAFNDDFTQKKELNINDFLGNSELALQKLSQIAAQQVTSQLQSSGVQITDSLKQMIQQGTQPTPDNYSNFNFNYNSLTIYFQQYQVAPGYVGPITVTIFKSTLDENSIKPIYLQ